jgi:hypothetical protein
MAVSVIQIWKSTGESSFALLRLAQYGLRQHPYCHDQSGPKPPDPPRLPQTATGLAGVTVTVVSACAPGAGASANAIVKVSYPFTFLTPIASVAAMLGGGSYASPVTLSAQGEEPCET